MDYHPHIENKSGKMNQENIPPKIHIGNGYQETENRSCHKKQVLTLDKGFYACLSVKKKVKIR
jgi:hypothetical protein